MLPKTIAKIKAQELIDSLRLQPEPVEGELPTPTPEVTTNETVDPTHAEPVDSNKA